VQVVPLAVQLCFMQAVPLPGWIRLFIMASCQSTNEILGSPSPLHDSTLWAWRGLRL